MGGRGGEGGVRGRGVEGGVGGGRGGIVRVEGRGRSGEWGELVKGFHCRVSYLTV